MARSKSRQRSGFHPSLYASLSKTEQAAVRAAMAAYNKRNPSTPYYEVEEFYQQVYRAGGWFA
ncbi:hypothetical protein ACSAZL_06390 [Methanosarcina sp. T3]|uniref:hypothetical protein n=1 Tax=Methanosarcina sp. T3 TaxID=3439062 RepID=UPI003F83D0EE